MAFLCDTHIAIWLWQSPNRLSGAQSEILLSDAPRWLSVASIWEMAIKAGLGKLEVPERISETAEASGFDILPISATHAEAVRDLPAHHNDPFDRMLIAQARVEAVPILTRDPRFAAYGVRVI